MQILVPFIIALALVACRPQHPSEVSSLEATGYRAAWDQLLARFSATDTVTVETFRERHAGAYMRGPLPSPADAAVKASFVALRDEMKLLYPQATPVITLAPEHEATASQAGKFEVDPSAPSPAMAQQYDMTDPGAPARLRAFLDAERAAFPAPRYDFLQREAPPPAMSTDALVDLLAALGRAAPALYQRFLLDREGMWTGCGPLSSFFADVLTAKGHDVLYSTGAYWHTVLRVGDGDRIILVDTTVAQFNRPNLMLVTTAALTIADVRAPGDRWLQGMHFPVYVSNFSREPAWSDFATTPPQFMLPASTSLREDFLGLIREERREAFAAYLDEIAATLPAR